MKFYIAALIVFGLVFASKADSQPEENFIQFLRNDACKVAVKNLGNNWCNGLGQSLKAIPGRMCNEVMADPQVRPTGLGQGPGGLDKSAECRVATSPLGYNGSVGTWGNHVAYACMFGPGMGRVTACQDMRIDGACAQPGGLRLNGPIIAVYECRN